MQENIKAKKNNYEQSKIIIKKLKSSFEKRKNEYIKHLSVQIYQTNISYNIKRIFHIRKNAKFSTNNCNQAELMLKEYQKSQTKFQKNSVYHRIYCTIRMNKRYTEQKIENEYMKYIKHLDTFLQNKTDIYWCKSCQNYGNKIRKPIMYKEIPDEYEYDKDTNTYIKCK